MYESAGFSKQAHIQYMCRRAKESSIAGLVINLIFGIRQFHNIMGLKKIYKLLQPDWIGRDKFIRIGIEHGFGIKRLRSYHRTTFSCKSACFTNLAAGLTITDINQVWVSDITYFRVGEVFYYLTFIEDVYSRRILGYAASKSLDAEGNCIALRMALKERLGMNLAGLIHHSDRGAQYASNKYLKLLSGNGIGVSMCRSVYENAHIERVNGTIKREYLQFETISTYEELARCLSKVVKLYNEERPHEMLGYKTPLRHEECLKQVPLSEREALILFKEGNYNYKQGQIFR